MLSILEIKFCANQPKIFRLNYGSNNVNSSIVNFNKFLTSRTLFLKINIFIYTLLKKFHELLKFNELLSLLNELKKYNDYIYYER